MKGLRAPAPGSMPRILRDERPAVNLSIGALGLNVQALASSAGGQGALANALVDITQDNLVIAGKTNVGANAFNGSGGVGNARAVGNLVLHATTGDIAVGSLGVAALAVDSGAGNAVASGLVNAFANGDGKITAGMITDRAGPRMRAPAMPSLWP